MAADNINEFSLSEVLSMVRKNEKARIGSKERTHRGESRR